MYACTQPGCSQVVDKPGRCRKHQAIKNRLYDEIRGTSTDRGYGTAHEANRQIVLKEWPICVICNDAPSVVADHYPKTRRQLERAGVKNPNHHGYMRGLCMSCHSRHTVKTEQPFRKGKTYEHKRKPRT